MDNTLSNSTPTLTADALSDPRRTAWPWPLRVGIAELLLLVLIVGILQRSQGSMLDDPGLGWHLRNVDAMAAEGGWLTRDSFSGPRAGSAWYCNQWLGDMVLYGGWQWGGLEGIAAVTTLVLALTFYCLYQMLLADRVPWPLALSWTFLAVLGTSLSWVARPNIFTLAFVMITAWTVDRYHRGKCSRRQTLWLLPLFVIWANTHGGFVAGLVILAVAGIVESALLLFSRSPATTSLGRRRAGHFCVLLTAAAAATLINPYGWRLYSWVFQLLGDPFFMNLHTEWLSPNFHDVGAFRYELLMLALPLLLAFSRRRSISLVALVLSLLWLHFALNGVRYVALYVVCSVPLMARLSADLMRQRLARQSTNSALLTAAKPRCGLAAIFVISLGLFTWCRYTDGFARHAPDHIPIEALQYVIDNHEGQNVFHEYGWGGWLTWHGWPRVKNWIDDRNEVQGQAHVERHFVILAGKPGWEDLLRSGGVQVVCVRAGSSLALRMADHPDWRHRYADRYAVVYALDASS